MICLLRSSLLFITQLSPVFFQLTRKWYFKLSLEECRCDVSNVMLANDWISALKALRSDNSSKLIFVRININSIRNKFDFLSAQVKGVLIDVLMVSKTKIDNSFSVGNCVIDGFSIPYRYTSMLWLHHVVSHRRYPF